MLDRFYHLVLRAEVGLLNFSSEIVTQIGVLGNLRALILIMCMCPLIADI